MLEFQIFFCFGAIFLLVGAIFFGRSKFFLGGANFSIMQLAPKISKFYVEQPLLLLQWDYATGYEGLLIFIISFPFICTPQTLNVCL
jgi:hypothetical protein